MIIGGIAALAFFYFTGKVEGGGGGGSLATEIGQDIAKGGVDIVKGAAGQVVDDATSIVDAVSKTIYDAGYEHGEATRNAFEDIAQGVYDAGYSQGQQTQEFVSGVSTNVNNWLKDTGEWFFSGLNPQPKTQPVVDEGLNISIGGLRWNDVILPGIPGAISAIGTSASVLSKKVKEIAAKEPESPTVSIGQYTGPTKTSKTGSSGRSSGVSAKSVQPVTVVRNDVVYDELGQGMSIAPEKQNINQIINNAFNPLKALGIKLF